jgi:mannitol-1-phosphate 5-dehydrogenase
VSPFAAYTDRKLYIHNAGHAMLGYLGYLRGYQYGYDGLVDPKVYALLSQALYESSRALMAEHHMDAVALSENVQYLLDRFANRALGDPISRLARDPMRKLAPGDRLVGAARLAQKHAIVPQGLAWGIAAGLAFDDPEDAHAAELQAIVNDEGFDKALQQVCGIRPDEPLASMVRECYRALQSGSAWTET